MDSCPSTSTEAHVQVVSFTGVEELDEANREVGWNIEYRQLHRGVFSAQFASTEGEGISLASERFEGRLQILAEPPPGMISIVVPVLDAGTARVCGSEMSSSDMVVFPSGSEMEFLTTESVANDAIFLPEEDFLEMSRIMFPDTRLLVPGSARIVRGDAERLARFHHSAGSVLQGEGALEPLVVEIMSWIDDAGQPSRAVDRIENGAAGRLAHWTRGYIEEHFRKPIHMDALCREAGVGLRTVQRTFAAHYQCSPTEYIKLRRLNAARRGLAAADPKESSVTSIALASGFTHLGRFSVEYRAHFGESPSETLLRT